MEVQRRTVHEVVWKESAAGRSLPKSRTTPHWAAQSFWVGPAGALGLFDSYKTSVSGAFGDEISLGRRGVNSPRQPETKGSVGLDNLGHRKKCCGDPRSAVDPVVCRSRLRPLGEESVAGSLPSFGVGTVSSEFPKADIPAGVV